MVNARRKTAPPAPPTQSEVTDAETIDFSDALDAASLSPHVARLQAELGIENDGQSFKVHVSRITAEGKDARVWDGPPEDYDLMHIARKYGGSGDYRVKLYGPHDSGRTVIRANEIMTVLLSPEEDAAIAERRNPALGNRGPQFDPQGMAAMIAQTVAQTIAAAIAPLTAHPPRNAMEDLQGLANVIKTIQPAPVAAPTGGGFTEMLANFRALKELTSPAEAADKIPPGDYALNKGVDMVMGMLGQHAVNQQRQPAPQLPPPVATVKANNAPQAQTEEQQEMELKLQLLRIRLRALNAQANAKANAREEAEKVYEDLPDDVLQALGGDPEWFSMLCGILPECAPNREWYELMRLRIVEMAVEDNLLPASALTAATQSSTTAATTPPQGEKNGDSGTLTADGSAGGNNSG